MTLFTTTQFADSSEVKTMKTSMKQDHFCVCPVVQCPRHPSNHSEGCDPCIKDNLAKKKMPACFFHAVHEDMSGVTDYSMQGFVEFFNEHCSEYPER